MLKRLSLTLVAALMASACSLAPAGSFRPAPDTEWGQSYYQPPRPPAPIPYDPGPIEHHPIKKKPKPAPKPAVKQETWTPPTVTPEGKGSDTGLNVPVPEIAPPFRPELPVDAGKTEGKSRGWLKWLLLDLAALAAGAWYVTRKIKKAKAA